MKNLAGNIEYKKNMDFMSFGMYVYPNTIIFFAKVNISHYKNTYTCNVMFM